MRLFIFMLMMFMPFAAGAADERMEDIARLHKKIEALTAPLDEVQKSHFMMIYNNHNLLNVVSTIEDDVKNAVDACGENNPDIKQKMRGRYDEWQAVLKPVKREARAHLDNMILVQDYTKSTDVMEVLNISNSVRIETANQFKKVPVSDLKACNYLYTKMTETEDQLLRLLRSTMITLPDAAQSDVQDATE